ncbi:unnamed protein product [Lactuca saligna]|uniref:Uncharacterized protein n=1 Tax=Lactuca saligna TaxID=75948 RepID=A0AA35YZ95_LACSI|nr:unnamed protein product [Lactuca saligna]
MSSVYKQIALGDGGQEPKTHTQFKVPSKKSIEAVDYIESMMEAVMEDRLFETNWWDKTIQDKLTNPRNNTLVRIQVGYARMNLKPNFQMNGIKSPCMISI